MTLHRLLAGIAFAPAILFLSPAAQAQVTVFGLLDLGLRRLSASGAESQSLVNGDGNTSSRIGFRGSEDLGGGLKANFWIESAINVDNGTSGATSTNNKDSVSGGLTWGRRSTVGLQGSWGELRLGRDYVPSFGNLTTAMHPFGTNGVGSSGLLFYPVNSGGTTVRTSVRASNSIGYHLPANAAGLYGALMIASGEQPGGTATAKDGNHQGLRLGWRSGGWNMAAATGRTRYASGDYRQSNIGLNYKLGAAKLMALWGENRVGVTRTRALMLGTQWDVSAQGELRIAYTTLKASRVASDATHLAIGSVHALSQRSALSATAARIDHKGAGRRFHVGLAPTTPGGSSSGLDLGLRHSF
ncbi:porin [Paucibacter sp. XJ19-41]|uniref:porin n=1 Tax=Paucibacter sp. XJ19-41 TaxID=2927824 RepID=UPI00234B1A39|nr:porin [Paucibacter sp. XJ19-41]MDC6168050.1 porin [Paucibacter sp. XJ19-41]